MDADTRQAWLPTVNRQSWPGGWVTICNWCECVVVNAARHAELCPNRPETP